MNVAVWGACKIKSGMEFYAGIYQVSKSQHVNARRNDNAFDLDLHLEI